MVLLLRVENVEVDRENYMDDMLKIFNKTLLSFCFVFEK